MSKIGIIDLDRLRVEQSKAVSMSGANKIGSKFS